MLQYIQQLEQRIAELERQKQAELTIEKPPKPKRRGIISLFI